MNYKRYISLAVFLCIYFLLLHVLKTTEINAGNSSITTYWDTFWYSIVTLTTVGYGDISPVSPLGRIIGLIFVVGSVTILGAIISKATDFLAEMREKRKMGQYGTKFKNHVVIIGMNSFAKHIIQTLIDAHQKVAVVLEHKEEIDLLYERFGKDNFFALYSSFDDYASLKKVNIEQAKFIHPALNNDTEELVMILNLKDHYPDLQFIVILEESNLKQTFLSAGVTHVLSKNDFVSKFMASFIFEPAVADLTRDLITPNIHQDSPDEYDIQQFYVNESNTFLNKTYGELFNHIKQKFNSLTIGIKKRDGTLYKLPPDHIKIENGDYVIFINNDVASAAITKEIFHVDQGEID